jgi:rRNA-processing protein FCF1
MVDLRSLIERYSRRGVLLDTNLLLLYLIGQYDRARIERFKRTVQYTINDFDLLDRLLKVFTRVRTLPHVLAEVNSLSSQLPGDVLTEFRRTFATEIGTFWEGQLPSHQVAMRTEFSFLGLTDSAILAESIGRYLVITDDLELCATLSRVGVDVLNFTVLRSFP